ncbi:MAG: asparagine synthase (glutamine-hydrolyzing) [Magnetococcales bacterium]|nr:asparagine synthase (glutamine-hydrolyzing) [Magnetococcales bacterium]
MCGICGVVLRSGEAVRSELIEPMNQSLAHRGPDGQGVFMGGHAALGHRRLAMLDLSGGAQPMASSDGRYHMVYNGEVYNFLELRTQLEALGHKFTTRSDTEVVLQAFCHWGTEAFARFNGMFALAIWDSHEQDMFLARDRFGIKPLYTITQNGRLALASEIKAFYGLDWWDRSLDPLAVDEFFSYLVIPEPRTIYQAVRSFPPAHWGVYRQGTLTCQRFWDARFEPSGLSWNDAVEGLHEAMDRSIRMCLRSDVPVGAFLSGGVDSGGVVSYASTAQSGLQTFSCGFSDAPTYNELPLARELAQKFRTSHHELDMPLNPEHVIDLAREVLQACDQPFADYSALAQLELARFAGQRVKTVLSGDGGDEIFGGYPTVYAPVLAQGYRMIPRLLRRGLRSLSDGLPVSSRRIGMDYLAKRFVRGAELPLERAHFAWKEATFAEDKYVLYTENFLGRLHGHDAFAPMEQAFGRVSLAEQPVHRLLYVDMNTFLRDDNLPKVDRTSMAVSLEVRLPLLNNDVVDFMLGLPPAYKIRPFSTKRLYRRLLDRQLPARVLKGKKKGFTPPMNAWLKGGLSGWARDTLGSSSLADLHVIRPHQALAFLEQHRAGRADHNRMLWCCLMLALWSETDTKAAP